MIGVIVDTKEFYDEFPKIMNEFFKKSDLNLSFYYRTGHQTRYRDFNKLSKDRVKRLDPVVFISNRASLPQANQLTARDNFHRAPVPLPPVDFDWVS